MDRIGVLERKPCQMVAGNRVTWYPHDEPHAHLTTGWNVYPVEVRGDPLRRASPGILAVSVDRARCHPGQAVDRIHVEGDGLRTSVRDEHLIAEGAPSGDRGLKVRASRLDR